VFCVPETGSAAFLVAMAVIALVWINIDAPRMNGCGKRFLRLGGAGCR